MRQRWVRVCCRRFAVMEYTLALQLAIGLALGILRVVLCQRFGLSL